MAIRLSDAQWTHYISQNGIPYRAFSHVSKCPNCGKTVAEFGRMREGSDLALDALAGILTEIPANKEPLAYGPDEFCVDCDAELENWHDDGFGDNSLDYF